MVLTHPRLLRLVLLLLFPRPRLQRFGAPQRGRRVVAGAASGQADAWLQQHGQALNTAQRNGGAIGPTHTFAQAESDGPDWSLMSGAGKLLDVSDRRGPETKPWLAQTVRVPDQATSQRTCVCSSV